MRESKLINTLSQLTNKQRNDLEEFLQSTYFNKSDDLLRFYQHVKKFAPSFRSKQLNKEKVFSALFPHEAFNGQKIAYLMTSLLNQLEHFVTIQKLEEDTFQQGIYLLDVYMNWKLDKGYAKTIKRLEEELEETDKKDTEYYFQQLRLQKSQMHHSARTLKREYDEHLQQVADGLDIYYMADKLKLSCEILNRQKIIANQYELRFLDEILAYLEHNPFEDVPVITLYQQVLYTYLYHDDTSQFFKLKDMLPMAVDELSALDSRNIYQYAVNYCIRKTNRGQVEFVRELFELYKAMLTNDLLTDNGILSPWTYKNIVTTGIKLEEYEWTEQFIDDYRSILPDEYRDNMYTYNFAHIHFAKGNYDSAIELLRDVEFSDVYLNLSAKALLAKIYYEDDELDVLMSHLESFRMYVRRNKVIGEARKTVFNNFIRFTRRLLKFDKGDNKGLDQLQSETEETKQVAELDWLLKKIASLKK
jgi:hypothetical protein